MNPQQPAAPAVAPEPAVTPQVPTPEPPPAPAPAAPEGNQPDLPADIKQRLDEAEKAQQRIADLERISQQHQSERDRMRQQLQTLVGAQPQADPIQPYVKRYAERGFQGEDALFLAQRDFETDQRIASLQNALTGQTQVPSAVYGALNGNPVLQTVMNQTQAKIQQYVSRGDMSALDPQFIQGIAAIEYVNTLSQQTNGKPPTPTPSPIPNFPSQFGPISGYQQPPAAPQPDAMPPHIKAMADAEKAAVAAKYNFNQK